MVDYVAEKSPSSLVAVEGALFRAIARLRHCGITDGLRIAFTQLRFPNDGDL